MVAAAFKIAMTVINSKGQIRSVPLTCTDMNAAYALYPSGGNELPLSSLSCVITDMVYTSAGTDTSQLALYVNGVDTGVRIYNGANLGTVYNRQLQTSPISIPASALVKFIQLT